MQGQFCGWNSNYDPQLQDPAYIEYIQEMLDATDVAVQKIAGESELMTVEIPIVFHIVHKGTTVPNGDNILYQDVVDAFDRLNDDFDGTGITFCLAQRDELGNQLDDDPTNGIIEPGVVRVDASGNSEYMTSGIPIGSQLEFDIKTLGTPFSNYSYLNVWVVSSILGSNTNGVVQGVGYMPFTTAPEIDGIMMKHSIFNLSTNRVLTHEVGHYLGLFHTFQGDDSDFNGIEDTCPSATADFPNSDEISDTDPHKRSANGPCPTGDNLCNEIGTNTGIYTQLEDITNNHMDYSMESCRVNFTDKQVLHMLATVDCHRKGLTHSLGCALGCSPIFSVDYSVVPDNPIAHDAMGENGESATFTASTNLTTYQWHIDGVLDTNYENVDLEHTFDSPGDHVVCIRSIDASGCKIETCKTIRVYVAGLCYDPVLDPCELLLNGDLSQYDQSQVEVNGTSISVHFNKPLQDVTKICNWMDYIVDNKQKDSPHLALNWMNFEPNAFFISVGTINSESIGTTTEMPLIEGNKYNISFEYSIWSINGEANNDFYIGFSDELGVGNSNNMKLCQLSNPNYTSSLSTAFSNYESFESDEFIYDDDFGKYIFIAGIPTEMKNFVIIIKNLSVKECNFCGAQPFFQWNDNLCGQVTFDGENQAPQNNGLISWSINGETLSNSVGQEDYVFDFPFGGKFKVCMDITCPNGITKQYCEDIEIESIHTDENGDQTVCEFCTDPTNIYDISARKCGTNSNEFLVDNFAINVDKGFKPCLGEEFLVDAQNGTIETNDWYVDSSDPNFDLIYVSFTFLAENPNLTKGASLGLCDAEGNSVCIKLYIDNPQTCNTCEDGNSFVVGDITVNCNDLDLTDQVYVYSGSFDFAPPTGFMPCGTSTTSSGLDAMINNTPNPDGSFPVNFDISTNNMGAFNTSITLCFSDGVLSFCYTIDLQVVDPCIPNDSECDEFAVALSPLKCTEDIFPPKDPDPNDPDPTVEFAGTIVIPSLLLDEFHFCEDKLFSSESLITNFMGVNGITAFIYKFDLPCSEVEQGLPLEITFYFCHDDGREYCYDLTAPLECEFCDHGSKLRNDKNSMDVTIYPNPTNGEFSINVNSVGKDMTYVVRNILGEVIDNGIIQNKNSKINLFGNVAGVYFVEISNQEESHVKKVIFVK